jgi:hypothetical protein
MHSKNIDTRGAIITTAFFVGPAAAFLGLIGAGAAISGIQHDPQPQERHEITVADNQTRLKCMSEHVLRVTLHDGKYDLINVGDCVESDVVIPTNP